MKSEEKCSLKCSNLKLHSLTGLVKNNLLKMLKTLNKRLIIILTNSMTSKMIPVRTEILENIIW